MIYLGDGPFIRPEGPLLLFISALNLSEKERVSAACSTIANIKIVAKLYTEAARVEFIARFLKLIKYESFSRLLDKITLLYS